MFSISTDNGNDVVTATHSADEDAYDECTSLILTYLSFVNGSISAALDVIKDDAIVDLPHRFSNTWTFRILALVIHLHIRICSSA